MSWQPQKASSRVSFQTIVAIPSRDVTAPMANLASQGLRLQSILVHHRFDTSHKLLICQQAVEYARYADDINTLVTALIELAAAHKFEGHLEKRLSTLQEALGYSVQSISTGAIKGVFQ